MIYSVNPNMLEAIPDALLALKYTDGTYPVIVTVEKSAIHFDPPGTAPETDDEWAAVTASLGKTLEPLVFKLLPHHDIMRSTESGVRWRHLDLTAAMLAENSVELLTMAHYMVRHAAGAFRPAP
jgi:hypothetical protein